MITGFARDGGVRRAAGWAAVAMDAASVAATVVAVFLLASWGHRLFGWATGYFEMGGGWEFVGFARKHAASADGVRAMLPGIQARATWFCLAWFSLVAAGGCALLALAGARSLWWRAHGLLRAV